ncbi:AAA family ATPase [Saccharomonospora viridis]|uniref:AAA family ATPase n=1 Tax=Saccharomonospora viridis TaxID=1852 RepID=UPI002409BDBF|nr:AAA family ATPase [Saccharomonospora viridis]
MLTLKQAARLPSGAGQRLPGVWSTWEQAGIIRRRGQLHLSAAPPGGYKSTVALIEACKMRVPTLYVWMDGDTYTASVRLIQSLSLIDQASAEAAYKRRDPVAMTALDAIPHMRFTFPQSPDIDEIVHHVWAYAEAHGDWPHWLVIDNLMDIEHDEDEIRGTNRIMGQLATLARMTNAGVHVLHHVTGEYEQGDLPVPMSGLRNKVSKKPHQILTACRGAEDGQLWWSVVKNRFGPADPAGMRVRAPLWVDGFSLNVWDQPTGAT